MPRRSILSRLEREHLLVLPETDDELTRHYMLSEPDLSGRDRAYYFHHRLDTQY